MKKKILKILVVAGVIIILCLVVLGFFVASDLAQEKKLRTELDELNHLVNSSEIDMESINERLDRVIANGDYAVVERAFKSYLKDSFDVSLKIAGIINDEKITTLLTASNYQEDGKDFVNTKQYIIDTKNSLEDCKEKYIEYLTEEKAMSYINNKDLDSYYVELYQNEFVGDMDADFNDKTVENAIDDLISILDSSFDVVQFLSENQTAWQIDGDNIVFANADLSNQYDQLLAKVIE